MECPECGKKLDSAAPVDGNVEKLPADGDIMVCVYCASVLAWKTNPQGPPRFERFDVETLDNSEREVVEAMRNLILTSNENGGKLVS